MKHRASRSPRTLAWIGQALLLAWPLNAEASSPPEDKASQPKIETVFTRSPIATEAEPTRGSSRDRRRARNLVRASLRTAKTAIKSCFAGQGTGNKAVQHGSVDVTVHWSGPRGATKIEALSGGSNTQADGRLQRCLNQALNSAFNQQTAAQPQSNVTARLSIDVTPLQQAGYRVRNRVRARRPQTNNLRVAPYEARPDGGMPARFIYGAPSHHFQQPVARTHEATAWDRTEH